MMPGPLDLEIYEGDDQLIPLDLTQKDGTPVMLTGLTGRAQVRTEPGGELVFAFTVAIDEDLPNRVWLSAPGSATVGKAGDWVWDLELTSPRRTWLAGSLHVEPEVTV